MKNVQKDSLTDNLKYYPYYIFQMTERASFVFLFTDFKYFM